MSNRTLVRSRDHRVIAGVCGGIAEYFEIDPMWVRIGTVIASLFSAGIVIGAYLVAWGIFPDQVTGETGADDLYERYGEYRRRRDARQAAQQEPPTDTFQAD